MACIHVNERNDRENTPSALTASIVLIIDHEPRKTTAFEFRQETFSIDWSVPSALIQKLWTFH